MKKQPRFVIINGPSRQTLSSNPRTCQARVNHYTYRKGDLGLLHPSIVEFYSDYNSNTKDLPISCFPARTSFLDLGTYTYHEEDIPILLFEGYLLFGGPSKIQTKRDYFIAPLREREFTELSSTSLSQLKKEIKTFYQEKRISPYCRKDTLNREIKNQYNHLQNLDDLLARGIHTIPIETSKREISSDTIRSAQDLLKKIKENQDFARKPIDPDIRFDRYAS